MNRAWAIASAVVLALVLVLSSALIDANATDTGQRGPGQNTPEDIKKCNNEQSACKDTCDRTQIDVDNQIQQCKTKCDNDRAMCLQYLVGGNKGVTGGAQRAPTASSYGQGQSSAATVCCKVNGGYGWLSPSACSRRGSVASTPRRCAARTR